MKILDTTVRDGSYAVDFKFSCKDVRDLVARSEKIGLEYIEIGHGLGLNASSAEYGYSLQTDVEYMQAARAAAEHAKLGFFCIPGIARLEDIAIAKAHGMDFIRVGVNVNEYQKAFPYLKYAHKAGVEVFVNFMKTYTATYEEFALASKEAYEYGVECVYIVDSAGCMNTEEIAGYLKAARMHSDVKLGFHGHNNLGLAIENTYFCVTEGIDFIDCSYQGLGRSLGNASLEQMVMVLEKRGHKTGFDIPRVLEYGYAGLRNIVRDRLINPLDYICGYAGFHSSFIKDIYKCSVDKRVDPLRLIIAYSEVNKASMDHDILYRVAETLPQDLEDNPYGFAEYFSEVYNQ
ncbi:MAG: hypothetical protein NC124_08300 [Clostridium sp.]|nr:hypothetical protein [Clostridium sp.]